MKYLKKFIRNSNARIPFSVIGIFLILGSSFSAVYVTYLEQEKTAEIFSTLDYHEVEQVLHYAEADIARELNYASMFAMKYIGDNPVYIPYLDNPVAVDYADNDGDGSVDISPINRKYPDNVVKFNINWAKNITRVKLNEYIDANFMNGRYRFKDYIINVKLADNSLVPISDFRDIGFNKIRMKLDRHGRMIREMISESHDSTGKAIYDAYWEASVDLNITLFDLSNNESYDFTISPTCIITCRFPLMMELSNTYERTINGQEGDLLSNKLGILVTLISEGYTEARALVQWGMGPGKIKNIVDNRWLQYITNVGLITEEFMIFNSVDPMGLIELALNCGDLAALSDSEKDDLSNDLIDGTEDVSFLENGLDDIRDDVVDRLEDEFSGDPNVDRDDIIDAIENPKGDIETIAQASVGNLSEDLLYKVNYIYYYHRTNKDGEIVDSSGNVIVNGVNRVIQAKDADFYNDHPYSYNDPTDNNYEFRLGDPGDDLSDPADDKVFDRIPDFNKINQNVLDEIEIKLGESYNGLYNTKATRSIKELGYEGGWDPSKHPEIISVSNGDWVSTSKKCIGSFISSGNKFPLGIYEETWEVSWKRTDIFTMCGDYDYTTKTCNLLVPTYFETHDKKQIHTIKFTVEISYPDDNVSNVFNKKTVFGSAPHKTFENDDNIEILRSEYVNEFVIIRDIVLNDHNKKGLINETFYQYGNDTVNYKVDWLKGINGCIVDALKNITDWIKSDDDVYGKISSDYEDYSTTSDMDKGRIALLNEFNNRSKGYKYLDYYMDNIDIYTSAGTKSVALMRDWFVELVRAALSESPADKAKDTINNELEKGSGIKMDDYETVQNDFGSVIDDIGGFGGIQFGLSMSLERESDNKFAGWSEEVAFAIDQTPNYFEPHDETDDEPWYFNVRNTCLLGPTGLPILPIPPIPWFATINAWEIGVDGCFENFTITDTLNEAHVNPLFGHGAQNYRRGKGIVIDFCSGEEIGENQRIKYDYWTMNFAVVPPAKLPIGDQDWNPVEID